MAAREYLRLTKETVWGTFNSSATTKNTDILYIDLTGDNSFTVRKKPVQRTLRSAGSGNRLNKLWSSQHDVTGGLNLELYPEQASLLLAFATTLTSSELGSFTADHAIVMDDGSNTTVYARYLGLKVASGQLSASASEPEIKVSLDLIGKTTATITGTDFTEPSASDYPVGNPYLFTDTASPGFLTLGTSRSEFSNWSLSFTNHLDAARFEAPYVSRIKWCGRDSTLNTGLLYQAVTDRTDFEDTTATSCSLKIDNGTNSVTFDFKSGNYRTDVADDLKMGNVFYQNVAFVNSWNASAGVDFTVTTA